MEKSDHDLLIKLHEQVHRMRTIDVISIIGRLDTYSGLLKETNDRSIRNEAHLDSHDIAFKEHNNAHIVIWSVIGILLASVTGGGIYLGLALMRGF